MNKLMNIDSTSKTCSCKNNITYVSHSTYQYSTTGEPERMVDYIICPICQDILDDYCTKKG